MPNADRPRRASLVVAAAALLLAVAHWPGDAGAQDTSICNPQTEACREIVVQNNCTDQVWVGTLGSSVQCQSDDDCPSTSTCDTSKSV